VAPVGPVGPVGPTVPVGPVGPKGPVGPVGANEPICAVVTRTETPDCTASNCSVPLSAIATGKLGICLFATDYTDVTVCQPEPV